MNTKDLNTTDMKLHVLVYGKSGTGKTMFAGTFPKPFFIDFDNGMMPLRGKDIDFVTILGSPEFNKLSKPIQESGRYLPYSKFNSLLDKLATDTTYDTIVIDSLTTMDAYVEQYVLGNSKFSTMNLQSWGELVDIFESFMLKVSKIDKHIVVIAHEEVKKDELTGEILYIPWIHGKKLPYQLPLYFGEVYRAQVSRKDNLPVYELLSSASVKYTAKTRIGNLALREVPSFDVIYGKLLASKGSISKTGIEAGIKSEVKTSA